MNTVPFTIIAGNSDRTDRVGSVTIEVSATMSDGEIVLTPESLRLIEKIQAFGESCYRRGKIEGIKSHRVAETIAFGKGI